MRTKLLDRNSTPLTYYEGSVERKVFACPCGKGQILEEHDDVPGFRDHTVEILCPECKEKYEFDLTSGIRCWELRKKKIKKTAK